MHALQRLIDKYNRYTHLQRVNSKNHVNEMLNVCSSDIHYIMIKLNICDINIKDL